MQGKSVLSSAFLASLSPFATTDDRFACRYTWESLLWPVSPRMVTSRFSGIVRHVFREICGLDEYGERVSPFPSSNDPSQSLPTIPPTALLAGARFDRCTICALRRRDSLAPVHRAA